MRIATIDIVFTVIILFMAVRVAVRGIVAEFMSFAAVIIGIVSAVFLSNPLSSVIGRFFGESFWNPVIAFLIVFLAGYLLIKLFETALSNILESLELERLDRALGFFLGIAEGFIIVILMIFVLEIQSIVSTDSMLAGSLYVKVLLPLIPFLKSAILKNR